MLNIIFFIFLVLVLFVIGVVAYVAILVRRAWHRVHDTFAGSKSDAGKKRGDTTVYDTRSEEVAGRKIFSPQEGEYVDYTEE